MDQVYASYGHTVLCLPSYLPNQNPIETVWAYLKQHVSQRNVTLRTVYFLVIYLTTLSVAQTT
jgi:transposase